MKKFLFIIFVEIIAVTQASKPRSVNVALETVLEFDKKYDVDFINTMQQFLRKLKTTLLRNNGPNERSSKHLKLDNEDGNKQFLLVNFLADTVDILKSYKDEDLKTFFDSLDGEIKSWQTKKEIQKFTDKLGFRRLIERNLHSLKNSPATEIRRKLDSLSDKLNLSNHKGNGFVASFLNYIYKKESEAKLLNIINNLKLYRSGRRRGNLTDLKRIIRSGFYTILDPLLKLNSTTVSRINTFFHNFVTNTVDKNSGNDLFKKSKNKDSSNKELRQKHKLYKVLRENKVLDYIEDHKLVIDKHITTKSVTTKETMQTKPKILETINTTHYNIHTTKAKKTRKLKHKIRNLGKVKKPQDKRYEKQQPVVKNESVSGDGKIRKPVLIKLVSQDKSELKSLEQYLSSTTKRQKRLKKRRKVTTKKPHVHSKSTNRFRKAFRTTQLTDKGLSIEHFGNIFERDHRKSNDIDTFTQTISNISEPTESYGVNFTRYESGNISMEIRRNFNLSTEKEEKYDEENPNEANKVSKSIEENVSDTKTLKSNKNVDEEAESEIKGNIIVEKPVSTTTNVVETTTSTPVNNFTIFKKYNVSIVTKYFNIKPMKPKIILKQQDMETELNVPTTSRKLKTTTSAQTTRTQTTQTAKETKIYTVKTTENGLQIPVEDDFENETEYIDKDKETTISPEFKKFIKRVETNNDVNSKVKEQMKADLASLLAPPSTKSTVAELFTDPFDDLDGLDL